MKTALYHVLRLLTLTMLLSSWAVMAKAQEENADSTIAVVAYFCKGDTLEYGIHSAEYKVQNGDTIQTEGNSYEEIRIVVEDSLKDGYTLRITTTNVEYQPVDADNPTTTDNILQVATEFAKDIEIVVKVSENGEVQRIVNWKDVRDKAKVVVKTMLDKLYAEDDSIETVMPRQRFEAMLMAQYSTEELIRKSYSELDMLFGLHGKQFDVGQNTIEEDDTKILIEAGYGTYDEEQQFSEYDYFLRGRTIQQFDDETIKLLVSNFLVGLLNDSFGEKVKEGLDELDSMEGHSEVTEDYYWYANGWPALCHKTQKTIIGEYQKIQFKLIEWTSRAMGDWWAGHHAVSEEAVDM